MKKYQFSVYETVSRQRQAIMGFAALWIVYMHVGACMFSTIPLLGKAEAYLQYIGYTGVDIFFFLSGMGVVYSAEKNSISGFYRKRIQRLFFPWVLIVLLYGVLVPQTPATIIGNLFFVNYFLVSVHSPLWFIPSIAICYAAFPHYLRMYQASKNKGFFITASFVVWLVCNLALKNRIPPEYNLFLLRIPVFIAGMLFTCSQREKSLSYTMVTLTGMAAVFLIGLVLCRMYNFSNLPTIFTREDNGGVFACFLITVGLCPLLAFVLEKLKETNFIRKVLNYYGSLSLEVYCVHELLNSHVIPTGWHQLTPVIFNLLFLAIMTVCAHVFHLIVINLTAGCLQLFSRGQAARKHH